MRQGGRREEEATAVRVACATTGAAVRVWVAAAQDRVRYAKRVPLAATPIAVILGTVCFSV